jgi:hypothetical protein
MSACAILCDLWAKSLFSHSKRILAQELKCVYSFKASRKRFNSRIFRLSSLSLFRRRVSLFIVARF